MTTPVPRDRRGDARHDGPRTGELHGKISLDGYEGWMAQAACKDESAYDIRFPDGMTKKERELLWHYIAGQLFFERPGYEVARWACAVCPVRSQCLEFAWRTKAEYGVFAALAPEERRLAPRSDGKREPGWVIGRTLVRRSDANVRRIREGAAA